MDRLHGPNEFFRVRAGSATGSGPGRSCGDLPLMIYDGIPAEDLDQYLRACAWFTGAARLLRPSQDDLTSEPVRFMTSSSTIVITDGKVDGRNVWIGSSIPRRWPECIEQNGRRPARAVGLKHGGMWDVMHRWIGRCDDREYVDGGCRSIGREHEDLPGID